MIRYDENDGEHNTSPLAISEWQEWNCWDGIEDERDRNDYLLDGHKPNPPEEPAPAPE